MPPLPPPSARERAMQAARDWGWRWSDWLRESPAIRGEVLAYETLRSWREAYLGERARLSGERDPKNKAGGKAPSSASRSVLSSFGL